MQKSISLKHIQYSVHNKHLLDDVSFRCTTNERLCIFGENGAGKSTLFKILCGQIEPDSGVVERNGHIRFVYVPQEFDHAYLSHSIESYIRECAGETVFKKVYSIGLELGFNLERNKDKLCQNLSGGQQKILALSVALAISPDFLLLDEPENHLDIVSRRELIGQLGMFSGGIIFISHDRLLIDAIATKVGELAHMKLHISEGGYDEYIQMKMERIGGLQRAFDAESKRIRQLSSSIVILQQKALRGKEISAYRKAKEELESLKKAHKEQGRPYDSVRKISLVDSGSAVHSGKLLCRMKGGRYAYKDYKSYIFDNANLEIRSGSKIVLLGRNGSGKSTFLKCLKGELPLLSGEVTWADGITFAYFNQHSEFNPEDSALAIVKEKLNCFDEEAQGALGAMKFDLVRMKTPVKNLSGGEKMRLRFATVFGLKPDLIILDEPTNHIDEVTWEVLLEACRRTKSSILLVTHDYEFIEEFKPNAFWVLKGQEVAVRYKDLDTLLEELKGKE